MLRGGSMLQVVVMAISIPPALLMLALLALERWGDQPPPLAAAHQSATLLDLERQHRYATTIWKVQPQTVSMTSSND